jgi:sulfoxide reductase heme-binding subunit YedZ
MDWLRRRGAFTAINLLALVPMVWLLLDWGFARLSANPINDIQDRTGLYALFMLTVSLAGTPLYWVFGFAWLRQLRRLAGLWAFVYAAWHVVNLFWLDYNFNLTFLYQDIIVKPYIIVGMAAFVLLVPLVITSTAGWRKRLGRGWRRVHYLVYPAALLVGVHFIWQAKIDTRLPYALTGVIAFLLFLRLPYIRELIDWRGRRTVESP